ncbi:MAG: hypothetical protein KDH93_25380 [Rhodoferax sp.]|nr:hypothetical protein [Rhodoferax sp.]
MKAQMRSDDIILMGPVCKMPDGYRLLDSDDSTCTTIAVREGSIVDRLHGTPSAVSLIEFDQIMNGPAGPDGRRAVPCPA